ncbi:hypothetical protein [Methylopila sp. Yamaguchi]|uniref:hypothetical protein n=1 Tax=Methylopila sp. Yamaguchi TaxID=1437817 RepID=UPI000CBA7F61|nr:hypothetical protein [Methylopila sp. Yamaguchi]GBD48088.1 hypothetical protein METY_1301 [Methylopila sp. Yamaguchi]
MTKGTGYIDMTPEVLPHVLALLPRTYEVVGSDKAADKGFIRLILASDQIEGDGRQLTMQVTDDHGVRTAKVQRLGS